MSIEEFGQPPARIKRTTANANIAVDVKYRLKRAVRYARDGGGSDAFDQSIITIKNYMASTGLFDGLILRIHHAMNSPSYPYRVNMISNIAEYIDVPNI